MSIGFVRSAIVLGLLAVVGPFAIDLYLPAMPQIVADLKTDDAAVQFTFTVYFIAFGLAQLIYGPLADRLWPAPARVSRPCRLHYRVLDVRLGC
jgi:DHA1 family bicyclomycin/chloramphenicol resistance-like MFS transporter